LGGAPLLPAMSYFIQDATRTLLKRWQDEASSDDVAEAETFLLAEIQSTKSLRDCILEVNVNFALQRSGEELPGSELVDFLLKLNRRLWDKSCVVHAVHTLTRCTDGNRSCLRLLRQLFSYRHREFAVSPEDLEAIFRHSVGRCLACVQFFSAACVMKHLDTLKEACLAQGPLWDVRVGGCFAQLLPPQLLRDRDFVVAFMSRVRDDGLSLQRPCFCQLKGGS